MRTFFNSQMDLLNTELIKMGSLCEEIIGLSIKALQNRKDLYKEVANLESQIDRQENGIQDLCMQILLQQQPVAGDLRKVYSALKIISDMERIGDMALDIAKIAKELTKDDCQAGLEDMAKSTIEMVSCCVDCFIKQDLNIAHKVIENDDIIDGLFYKIKQSIITRLGVDSHHSEALINYLMIAKYFEKIADHSTNIAEWVKYSITGHYVGEE
ncbi:MULTISPECIES: phosphate signaling complex protein PhoU [unclassified Helicobacter]|uniref:phosphate signaling complex protein PhoU n=1 Tax=unclassified Helicobacter TaxID=2593540 RepID=UPI000CF1BAAA|nr:MULTISPECIES: phosphate signaling complex protein PhoU [unclassified Helicobacter]